MRRPPRGVLVLLGLAAVRVALPAGSGMRADTCRSTLICLGWSALALAVTGATAVGIRMLWLGIAAARAIAAIPAVRDARVPDEPRAALGKAVCLDSSQRTAFCAGILRPRVYVSTGLVAALSLRELVAVVEHERAHAARRDPLRRLVVRSAADVFFSIPLLRFLQHYSAERAELAADRAAIAVAGAAAVAGALAATAADGPTPMPGPAFDGAGPARVAQLLGDPIPARRPSPATVAASLAGVILVMSLAMCLGAMFAA